MDITALNNVNSGIIKEAVKTSPLLSNMKIHGGQETDKDVFESFLNAAVEGINTTNGYLSDAENEEIKLALGETENPHDLAIALQKASTALTYTIAVRDKFMEAYKEIMQIQI
ncbi:MAG: flagellar hook-basal body complex protein FliE [Roseburia sp.]|nr:flagellar hook-basal body complex protein FliE [Roseburia sp.]MCM1278051.1 flagellar hook-basal body complex protein FliE [Robinsoniella sp.]